MVDTRHKFNEVATAVALYTISLICVMSSFPRQSQYSQLNKHQFHSNNTNINKRSLKAISSHLTWANLCQKKTSDHL